MPSPQEINKQLADAQAAWRKNIGDLAVQKLQLYRKLQSALGGSFTATDADDNFVYVTERIHELFTGAWDDKFVKHKVPIRYLSMTDAQVLAERRESDELLHGLAKRELQRRYFEQKAKRVRQEDVDPDPFNDYDNWRD